MEAKTLAKLRQNFYFYNNYLIIYDAVLIIYALEEYYCMAHVQFMSTSKDITHGNWAM